MHDLFLKGQYDQCLHEIEKKLKHNLSIEDSYILDNNKLVCQSLTSLVSSRNVRPTIEDFFSLYDNCISLTPKINSSHAIISVDVQLIVLYNCQWYALATLSNATLHINQWDSLFKRVAKQCLQFSDGILSQPVEKSDLLGNLLENLKVCWSTLQHCQSNAIYIFTECLAIALLNILFVSKTQDYYGQISSIVKLVLNDSSDILARSAVHHKLYDSDSRIIFKFGLHSGPALQTNDVSKAFGLLAMLDLILSHRCQYRETNNSSFLAHEAWPSLWLYYQGLSKFLSGEFETALGYLLNGPTSSSSIALQCHHHCLRGEIYSVMGKRQKAVENFVTVTRIDKSNAVSYYYQGREYGKMGLHDVMLKSYQNLVTASKQAAVSTENGLPVEARILELLHDGREISKAEAIYVLAVAYGVNEMFEEASLSFEKVIGIQNMTSIITSQEAGVKSVVNLPHLVTILHEAAAMNLLTGNLVRSEELCRKAMSIYPNQVYNDHHNGTDVHGTRDTQWIYSILQQEFQMDVEETIDPVSYYEQYLSFFEEDVIGMLILADSQRIQDCEPGRQSLNQALLLLSKYIARTQNKVTSPEQHQLALVKALTSKTCLHIAKMQVSTKPFVDVDKMFKRALSCNNGDKDVLYHYANFLLSADKRSDAEKLWHTFFEKAAIVKIEQVQSLALRYLLRTQISHTLIISLSRKLGIGDHHS